MKVNTFVSRVSILLILFLFGFAGGQLVPPTNAASITNAPAADSVAVPAVRGVLYDGGFATYAATVTADSAQIHKSPDSTSQVVQTNTPATFLVTGQQLENSQTSWYQVLLPVRPNNTKGWIHASDVSIVGMRYRIEVHRKSFKLDVYKDNVLLSSSPIGLGTDKTPTPDGTYSVIELLRPPSPNGVYGSHVLGLSGYSDVITDWPGGGHIAIHGTNDPAHTLGHQVSHGCIRLKNTDVDALAKVIPLGTPVKITND